MNHPPLLIFDLDGTLFRGDSVTVPAVQQAFRQLGLPVPDAEQIIAFIGKPVTEYHAWLASHADAATAARLIAEADARELALIDEVGQLYPEILTILQQLRELPARLAICSNGPPDYVHRVVQSHNLAPLFDAVRCRHASSDTKPSMVAELLAQFTPSQGVVIGDRQDDIDAARANNLPSIIVTWGYARQNEITRADATAQSPTQLPELIHHVLRTDDTRVLTPTQLSNLQASYNCVSTTYAEAMHDEMDRKPFDRRMLDELADACRGRGPICDLGCGPGQIARYLHSRGAECLGVDLSPQMVAHASRLNPSIPFHQGNMLQLNFPDHSWAGIAAFYSIIHIPRPHVVRALRELHRVLKPDGLLLMSFHIGTETLHCDDLWGHPVNMDFTYFTPEEMIGYLAAADFTIDRSVQRDPDPKTEYPSRRGYILARKP